MSLKFEADPDQALFDIEIAVEDGASELYLVIQGSVLIAEGAGRLKVSLPPGSYTVRQRVGYEQRVHTIQISQNPMQQTKFLYPAISFPSPLPLRGTQLGRKLGLGRYLVAKGGRNFQLLLWSPNSDVQAQLQQVYEQLQLERFQTGEQVQLTVRCSAQAIVAHGCLEAGPYQLVQRLATGERRCLALWCIEGWVTSVYLLVLTDQLSGKPLPVELEHAGMTLLRPGLRVGAVEASLCRLEAARKTLGLGRRLSGWSSWTDENEPENPLLALLDAQLGGGVKHLELAPMPYPDSALFGNEQRFEQQELAGPPLLRHSWVNLLQTAGANQQLHALFQQQFRVGTAGVWFTWTELAETTSSQTTSRHVLHDLFAQLTQERGSALEPVVKLKQTRMERLLRQNLNKMTERHLYTIIAQVFQSEAFMNAWNACREDIDDQRFKFRDSRLDDLFSAFLVLTDKTLVQAIGEPALIRQAVEGLRLPTKQADQLSAMLLDELVGWLGAGSSELLSKLMATGTRMLTMARENASPTVALLALAAVGPPSDS
ncbi:hypothetical protein [Pseudomonas sp. GZD-209]|uniref:hypothetical protein n=1 Tax=Pseudomonas sp. GZD-209 TaxID=3404807 RepID=UPI003BB7EEB1